MFVRRRTIWRYLERALYVAHRPLGLAKAVQGDGALQQESMRHRRCLSVVEDVVV
jgi:hypothetical protein